MHPVQMKEGKGEGPVQEKRGGQESCSAVQLKGMSFSEQQAALAPGAQGFDVQQQTLSPVQQQGGGGTQDVHGAAERGTSGGGGALPHLQKIQSSFGVHDISNVQAYTGGAAADASSAMGAEAYATGNKVAFGRSPSLHTAAHEAAHIVQQRAGVSLKGGVGKAGDNYERHADAVADAVVQGKSAEGILDQMAGGSGEKASLQKKQENVQKKGSAVQMEEEQGAWLQQFTFAKDSYFDVIRQNLGAAQAWQNTAEVVDPPPAWKTALSVLGSVVLAAALGGVGGVLAGALIKEGAKRATIFVMNAAIDAGKKAVEEGVNQAVSAGAGSGGKAPLVAFCEQQKIGMSKSSKIARETFVTKAGTITNQRLTIADMQDIKRANDASFSRATTIQNHEMLIGWMNLLSGDSGLKDANKEDTSHKGILGLVISGASDSPYEIKSANAEGLNKGLLKSISGTKLSEWLAGGPRKRGLNVILRTGNTESRSTSYDVKSETQARIKAAGQWGYSHRPAIYFAFGVDSKTGRSWTDMDKAGAYDHGHMANAGRYFLNNVKGHHAILSEAASLTIPNVTS